MTILAIIVVLIIIALGFYYNNKYPAPIRTTVVNLILIAIVIYIILFLLGIVPNLNQRV